MFRPLAVLAIAAAGLAACTTTGSLPPTQVVRYHLGEPIARGTVRVDPLSGSGPASLEFKTYAAAVQTQLLRIGYAAPAPGAQPEFVAVVDFRRSTFAGPDRGSPVSIGLGGGGYSGGYRGGGVGLGGGISFPVGRRRPTEMVGTELAVTIKRRADLSPIWEGSARSAAPLSAPDAVAAAQADKLAAALFTGFPGESGRTIEVK